MTKNQMSLFDEEPPAPETYLWVNVPDLDDMGRLPGFGSPINLMIRSELGDELQPGGWYNKERLDESYIIIHTTKARAAAITDALEVLSRRKIKRAIRTRQTSAMPGKGWNYVADRQ